MTLLGVVPVDLPIPSLHDPVLKLSSLLKASRVDTFLAHSDRYRVLSFLVSHAADLVSLALKPSLALKSVNAYRLLVSGCLVGLDDVVIRSFKEAAVALLSGDIHPLTLARLCEITSAFVLRQPQLLCEHCGWVLDLLKFVRVDSVCELFCEISKDPFVATWLASCDFPKLLMATVTDETRDNVMRIVCACCDAKILAKRFDASEILSFRGRDMEIARKLLSANDDKVRETIKHHALQCLLNRGDVMTQSVVSAIDVLAVCAESGDIVQDIADTFLDMFQMFPQHSILLSAIVRYMSETAKWLEGHNEVLRMVPAMIAEIQARRCVVVAEAAAQIIIAVDAESKYDTGLRKQLLQINEYADTVDRCVKARIEADDAEWGN